MILPLCCLLWHLATPAWAQETLSLKECREMALKYNKEMAASVKQTESARYTAKSYKGNFFPNFTVSGTGLYSNADGPSFCPMEQDSSIRDNPQALPTSPALTWTIK